MFALLTDMRKVDCRSNVGISAEGIHKLYLLLIMVRSLNKWFTNLKGNWDFSIRLYQDPIITHFFCKGGAYPLYPMRTVQRDKYFAYFLYDKYSLTICPRKLWLINSITDLLLQTQSWEKSASICRLFLLRLLVLNLMRTCKINGVFINTISS